MSSWTREMPWVVFAVRDQLYGLPATSVREMADMPPTTPVPNTPPYVLGLITLRGQVIPAIDLRRRLGLPAAEADREELRRWLDRVEEGCAEKIDRLHWSGAEGADKSGRAPYRFGPGEQLHGAPPTRNPVILASLHRLEQPYRVLQDRLTALLRERGTDDVVEREVALAALRENEWAAFQKALDQVRERIDEGSRQIVVVSEWKGHPLGLAVDEVESIERLKDVGAARMEMGDNPDQAGTPATGDAAAGRPDVSFGVGKRVKDDALVLLLDAEALLSSASLAA